MLRWFAKTVRNFLRRAAPSPANVGDVTREFLESLYARLEATSQRLVSEETALSRQRERPT